MDIGMLWFDNDKGTDFPAKVRKAVDYYTQKYGQEPNLCYVSPRMLTSSGNDGNGDRPKSKREPLILDGVEIREAKSMLPNHFWVGISRKPIFSAQGNN